MVPKTVSISLNGDTHDVTDIKTLFGGQMPRKITVQASLFSNKTFTVALKLATATEDTDGVELSEANVHLSHLGYYTETENNALGARYLLWSLFNDATPMTKVTNGGAQDMLLVTAYF